MSRGALGEGLQVHGAPWLQAGRSLLLVTGFTPAWAGRSGGDDLGEDLSSLLETLVQFASVLALSKEGSSRLPSSLESNLTGWG